MLLRTLLGEQVGAGTRAADSGQSQGMPVGGLGIQRRVGKMAAAQSVPPRLEAPGALCLWPAWLGAHLLPLSLRSFLLPLTAPPELCFLCHLPAC